MIRSAELAENRPSVVDAMRACEKNSSAKDDQAHNRRLLPEGYRPGEHDVLCGRGRKCFNHTGNVRFRAIVQSFLPQYSKAVAKLEKSYILSDVVEQVRKNSGEGGFIRKDPDTNRWYEVGDFLAREKTSQAFRDVLHDKYKSSNTAKKKRRQEEQAEKLVRAHSNRSLSGNSLDASSVHSVGSSTSDTKVMRRQSIERSNSILNLGDAEDVGQHDDLLGGLDQEIANYARPRSFNRQGSLRAVLDFDTNRRAVLTRNSDGAAPQFYNRSSCPNFFAAAAQPPLSLSNSAIASAQQQQQHHHQQQSRSNNHSHNNNGSVPPISHIEIIQEDAIQAHSPMLFPDTLESAQFHDFDSFDTTAGGDGSVASNSSSNAGVVSHSGSHHQQQPQNWSQQHHAQPNLYVDASSVNSQAGSLRGFARQQPNVMIRRPMRHNSGNTATAAAAALGGGSMLLGVQQQIGNLGLNDSGHGKPSMFDTSGGGGGGQVQGNMQNMNGVVVGGNGEEDDDDNEEADRHYLPHGLQQQHQHQLAQQLLGMNQSPAHPGDPISGQGGNNGNVSNTCNINVMNHSHQGGAEDGDLLARLQSLESTGFDMDNMDDNPFEPVPLREG